VDWYYLLSVPPAVTNQMSQNPLHVVSFCLLPQTEFYLQWKLYLNGTVVVYALRFVIFYTHTCLISAPVLWQTAGLDAFCDYTCL